MDPAELAPPPYDQWEQAQPYPTWARARAGCPVIETPGNDWAPLPTFATTTFADAERVPRPSRVLRVDQRRGHGPVHG
ncbi:MAG: hypothetical protein R2695_16105 [Acidimicrobiales bacterium]